MEESILLTIKKMLGIEDPSYEVYDQDLIVYINSVFMLLNQLGIGPDKCFRITGLNENWSDFVDSEDYEAVKEVIYLRTKLVFDPPTNSFVTEALKKQCDEYEWRLLVQAEWRKNNSE